MHFLTVGVGWEIDQSFSGYQYYRGNIRVGPRILALIQPSVMKSFVTAKQVDPPKKNLAL